MDNIVYLFGTGLQLLLLFFIIVELHAIRKNQEKE